MLWLVWVILIPVLLIVAGVVIQERLRSGNWPDELGIVIGSVLFGSSLLGYFVTLFASPTLATWWQAPLLRVVWQIGGAVVLAFFTLLAATGSQRRRFGTVHVLAIALLTLGVGMSKNPLLDLLQGPLVLRGVSELNVRRSHGAGAKISADFKGRAPDGSTHQVDLTGWSANDGLERLGHCEDTAEVDVTVLRHLDRVLDARCR